MSSSFAFSLLDNPALCLKMFHIRPSVSGIYGRVSSVTISKNFKELIWSIAALALIRPKRDIQFGMCVFYNSTQKILVFCDRTGSVIQLAQCLAFSYTLPVLGSQESLCDNVFKLKHKTKKTSSLPTLPCQFGNRAMRVIKLRMAKNVCWKTWMYWDSYWQVYVVAITSGADQSLVKNNYQFNPVL